MVSPNPVSGAFHFGPLPSEGTFTLFDALGSPVGNGNLQAGDNILSTGNLHPGLYFIQASYSGKTIAMKLLVRE
jgi:hypothetical protein